MYRRLTLIFVLGLYILTPVGASAGVRRLVRQQAYANSAGTASAGSGQFLAWLAALGLNIAQRETGLPLSPTVLTTTSTAAEDKRIGEARANLTSIESKLGITTSQSPSPTGEPTPPGPGDIPAHLPQ